MLAIVPQLTDVLVAFSLAMLVWITSITLFFKFKFFEYNNLFFFGLPYIVKPAQ